MATQRQKEEFTRQLEAQAIDESFDQIGSDEESSFELRGSLLEIENQFRENCVLYFPPNRHEDPAWMNKCNLKATADFKDRSKLRRVSNRQIVQEAPLQSSMNWMLDVLLDHTVSLHETQNHPLSDASRLWGSLNEIIQVLLGLESDGRFLTGQRGDRRIAVADGEDLVVDNVFQLSSGQSSVLNIALSILRDFDMSGTKFTGLENVKGVVVIDEIDLHLHSNLQRNVLPEVIALFPAVQFVVTSHSPLFLIGMEKKFGRDELPFFSAKLTYRMILSSWMRMDTEGSIRSGRLGTNA